MSEYIPHRMGRSPSGAWACRAASAKPGDGPVDLIFVYLRPGGRLAAVIQAESLTDAWIIATGFGDDADIREKLDTGWRMYPAAVTWEVRD